MAKRLIYIAPDDTEHYYLPKKYNNVSPIHKDNYEALGWTTREEEYTLAQASVNEDLLKKEKAFVSVLLQYAQDLEVDLEGLGDITITSLIDMAKAAGADEEQITQMSSNLMMLSFDIMSESDKPWSLTWAELKARIPGYIEELA